jgi:glucuronide carrier protein
MLSALRIIGYGAGDAGCNVAFQMTGLFLLVFYTNVAGIEPAHAGAIFLFVKIWDAFADLFAGRLVDKTMTRWGKFRPFLLWYSIPLLGANILCFWMPFEDYTLKLIWATATYALAGLLYSLVNIPFGSLAGAMSQNPVDRARLSGARMVGSGATILVLSIALAPRIKSSADPSTTFLFTAAAFAVVGSALFAFTFMTAQETVHREIERVTFRQTFETVRKNNMLVRLCISSFLYLTGLNVVSALAIYLANDVLSRYVENAAWLTTLVVVICIGAVVYVGPFGPLLTRTLGKKRAFLLACATGVAASVAFALSTNLWFALISLFFLGLSLATLNTMTWALESDTVEYGEYQTGIRTEGATYAAFSFIRKVGQAAGAALAAFSLSFVGYDGSVAVQSAETVQGIQLALSVLTAIALLAAFLCMYSYPLTEKRFAQIVTIIKERQAAAGTAAGTQTVPTRNVGV